MQIRISKIFLFYKAVTFFQVYINLKDYDTKLYQNVEDMDAWFKTDFPDVYLPYMHVTKNEFINPL